MNWKFDFSPETSADSDVSELPRYARNLKTRWVKINSSLGDLHMMGDGLRDVVDGSDERWWKSVCED